MKEIARKPKLLYVVEATGGGVLSYLMDLANALSEEFDIYIAYGKRAETPDNIEELFKHNIHLIRVENFTRSISPIKDAKAFLEIKRLAKRIKPNIIHLNSSKAGVLGRLAFNGKKTALFYTPHGYSFLMSDYSPLKQKLFKFIELICAKRASTTISCGKGEYLSSLGLTKRVINIDNGINIKKLQALIDSNIQTKKRGRLTVFSLSRISFQKNPELFNQIAKKLSDVDFVWIGDGQLKNQLTSKNIKITGWLNREEAIACAMSADIFLLPSRWEGLPISLLEAMYMKKLCIVSNVQGNNNVIINNINGYLCNDLNDYVKRIEDLKKKGINQDIIDNAYQDIVRHYNIETMVESYRKVYNDALK